MRLLDPATFTFTGQPSYLNHPPFYYWLMAALGPEVSGQPGSLIYLRLLNVAIAAAGLIALLTLAVRMKLEGLEFYAFAIACAAAPVLVPLAGSVNNDNLGFAGGALTLLGAYTYLGSRQRSWLLLAFGGMLAASLAKLTGLMLSGGFLVAALGLSAMRRTPRGSDLAIVAVSLAIASAPYIAFAVQYGSPTPNTPAQMELLRSGAATTGWGAATRLGPLAYTFVFLRDFLAGWMPSLQPRNVFQLALLVLPGATLVLAAAGTALSLRAIQSRRDASETEMMIVAGMLAIVATLIVHIVFSYQRHLQTGWMLDAYPRYYLPMIAIVPLAAIRFVDAVASSKIRSMLLLFLIAAPLVFGLLGGPLG
jgi:hypothetical protein